MRGFAAIGLVGIKRPENYGGVLRAAHAFGAAMVCIQDKQIRFSTENTSRAEKHIPTMLSDDIIEMRPHGTTVVAVEITPFARPLTTFVHPERALYIFGPERGSIPEEVLNKCNITVKIPSKICLNLAATVNVVLYDRLLKRSG